MGIFFRFLFELSFGFHKFKYGYNMILNVLHIVSGKRSNGFHVRGALYILPALPHTGYIYTTAPPYRMKPASVELFPLSRCQIPVNNLHVSSYLNRTYS